MCDDDTCGSNYGFQGDVGFQGMTNRGNQGQIGYQANDVQGAQGPQGFDGTAVEGIVGETGVQGARQNGLMGVTGKSGTDNIGMQGYDGANGCQGSQGPTSTGPQGDVGPDASLGGPQGLNGDAGFQGAAVHGVQGMGYDYFGPPMRFQGSMPVTQSSAIVSINLPPGRYLYLLNGAVQCGPDPNSLVSVGYARVQTFIPTSFYQYTNVATFKVPPNPFAIYVSMPGTGTVEYDLTIIKCG